MKIYIRTFFLLLISLSLISIKSQAQCGLLSGSTTENFITSGVCGPVTANWTLTYDFISPVDPSKVYIQFTWNDPANTVNILATTANGANTQFTASDNFSYPPGMNCDYSPNAVLLYDVAGDGPGVGDICSSSVINKTVASWADDNSFTGTVAVSPANYEVCSNQNINGFQFQDISTPNCNAIVSPASPNELTRWIQFVYGTGSGPYIPSLTLDTGGGTVQITDGNGSLLNTFYGPVIEILVPVTQAQLNELSYPISFPSGANGGDEFEITLRNWNICNAYDSLPFDGVPPIDPVNGDNPSVTATASIVINSTPGFQVSNVNSPSCSGFNDGQAFLAPTAGLPPFSYFWTGPQNETGPVQQNLIAGTYYVTMIDGNGCTNLDSVLISPAPAITSSFNVTDANCNAYDGVIDLTAGGGTGTLEFLWNNGEITEDIDSLNSGLYVVTITDQNDCEHIAPATVNSIGGPTLILDSIKDVTCYGGGDGAVYASLSGTFQIAAWSNGFTTDDISNLQAGPYQLTAVDTLTGCNSILSINVPEPAPLQLNISVGNANCNVSDGQALVNVTGGNGGYLYNWSSGGSSSAISNLSAGSYSLTVSDSKGCIKTKNFTVSEIGAPQIIPDSIVNPDCGVNSGSIFISTTGDTIGYTYSWSNGSTNEDLVSVPIGNYDLTVTAPNTCKAFYNASIQSKIPPTPQICLVTVDSATGSNQVVWERGSNKDRFDFYKIWRESTSAGVYQLIGTVPADSIGLFTDSVSNPLIKAYRYKLSVVDTCGNESNRSSAHKTIHLLQSYGVQANSVNLNWGDYQGFSYSTFFIYRNSQARGWEEIDSLAVGLGNRYTDIPPFPRTDPDLFYAILVNAPDSCDPNKGEDYTKTRSNPSTSIYSPPLIGMPDLSENEFFKIYPNPTSEILFIKNNQNVNEIAYRILDMRGLLIQSSDYTEKGINLKELSSGIYIIEINTDKIRLKMRFIKN